MSVPVIEQTLSKYGARLITYKGKTQSTTEWAKELGISSVQLLSRIRKKPASEWFKPLKRNDTKYVTVNGVKKSVRHWAEETGIPVSTLFQRISLGWPTERLFSTEGLSHKTLKRIEKLNGKAAEVDVETTTEFDDDLALKRQIAYWRGRGLDDREIYIKLRNAA